MKKLATCIGAATALLVLLTTQTASAALIVEVDTDGTDDGVLTYSPNFSFGGDTTTASQSIPSLAYGMTGGDSIFGGNGLNFPDTYIFTYDPSVDADNLTIPIYTALGDGNYASGKPGGAPGIYSVYATWPFTTTVSGGDTRFSGSTAGDSFVTVFDQNRGGAGTGHFWYKVGEIDWNSGDITITMQPTGGNSFVSMRAAGMLFEYEQVPEPSAMALLGVGSVFVWVCRRQMVQVKQADRLIAV